MAQLTSLERLNRNKGLVSNNFTITLKRMIHPIMLNASKSKIGYKMVKCSPYTGKTSQFSKKRPIIFVSNHATSSDIPIALNAINEHTVLFVGKQQLEKIDEMFFNLNETIWVDRKDKEDKKLSKLAMEMTLKRGRNILVFPEGTWNTTDSNLMHELPWGIVEVAQKSNAIIVPIALDYDYDKRTCRYKFGEPIDVKNDTLSEGITTVRNSLASLRWKFFETKGKYLRESINPEKEREKIMNTVDEYPKLDYDYEQSVIFHSTPQQEEVFAPIKKLRKAS